MTVDGCTVENTGDFSGGLGEKDTASGLASGETGVVGTGKAAANDVSFDSPTGDGRDWVSGEKSVVGTDKAAANDASFEGAKKAAAANELARLSERAVQVRSELKIGSGRNIAVAEYSIDGQSAELVGVSGLAKHPGTVDVPEKQVFDTIQTVNNPRTMDSEYKILSSLADKLTPSSQGVVNIYSELPVCVSCSGVISQFQQRFPGVIVNVETGQPR